eukprot:GHVQ01007207.1.p1 GENE.GHVQ01007207.1~~GHVQ01007207.1.p1  ORF type:complete len:188 (+),score=25.94 GHVQ01007207.1:197-760(+)
MALRSVLSLTSAACCRIYPRSIRHYGATIPRTEHCEGRGAWGDGGGRLLKEVNTRHLFVHGSNEGSVERRRVCVQVVKGRPVYSPPTTGGSDGRGAREVAGRGAEGEDVGGVFVHESARLIGNVSLGRNSSVWPMVVIRADVHNILIGSESNVQDGTVIHCTGPWDATEGHDTRIGNGVSIGGPLTV